MNIEAFLLLVLGIAVFVAVLLLQRRKSSKLAIRPLAAFQELETEIGLAAESGGTIHMSLGNGSLIGEDSVTSLAGLQVVEILANAAAAHRAPLIVTVGDPTLLVAAQDVVRRAYERRGLENLYDSGQVRYVAPSPLAYAAGAANIVSSKDTSTNLIAGAFGPEVSLIAEAGARRNQPPMAAVATVESAAALYPSTVHLAIGEELFALGSQATGERRQLLSLAAQDIMRVILMVVILATSLWQIYLTLAGG